MKKENGMTKYKKNQILGLFNKQADRTVMEEKNVSQIIDQKWKQTGFQSPARYTQILIQTKEKEQQYWKTSFFPSHYQSYTKWIMKKDNVMTKYKENELFELFNQQADRTDMKAKKET